MIQSTEDYEERGGDDESDGSCGDDDKDGCSDDDDEGRRCVGNGDIVVLLMLRGLWW